jgi:two-component system response regulator AtoC
MSKGKDTQNIFRDVGKPESKQKLATSGDRAKKLSETGVIQSKQGIWRTYDVIDGLYGAGVTCLHEDRQGYLWLGTAGAGLRRYNGSEFVTYTTDDGLAHNHVWAICEDHKGQLWFGAWGVSISCFDGQNIVAYRANDRSAYGVAHAICEDREGRLWIGTRGSGLFRFADGRFIAYEGLACNIVWAICEDRKGRLWIGTDGGGVSCFDGKRFIKTYTTDHGLAANYVRAICEDSDGQLWFGTASMAGAQARGASRFDGKRFITYTTADGLAGDSITAIYKDHQERLWFGTWGSGVSMLHREVERGETSRGGEFITFTSEDGLLDNLVIDILQDREGGVWFAHPSSGLTRYESGMFQPMTEASVRESISQGSEGGLFWFDNKVNSLDHIFDDSHYGQPFGVDVSCRLEDSKGFLWVATLGDGLYCYDSLTTMQQGHGKHYTQEDGLESNWVRTVLETRDGTIWVGTQGEMLGKPGCLCRFRRDLSSEDDGENNHGKAFEAIPTSHPLISRLFEDSRGILWMVCFHTGGGGLSCYDGKTLINYTMEDGLPSDSANSMVEDDDGNLWIGTGWGLCRFDGEKFITYSNKQGLPDFVHQYSAKDSSGQLWFGSFNSGLYRYDGKHFQWLTTADGLPSNSISKLVPQPDGSMIIITQRGTVRYFPITTTPPQIEIREVIADNIYQNPKGFELTTTEVTLLTISYRGLSFSTRQMLYSYILEGHDEEWQDTWSNQVRYENLPVGEYIFKVIAINRDLVLSEAPATLKIWIAPDPRDAAINTLQTELQYLRHDAGSKYHFQDIIGNSHGIRLVRALMERAIDSGLTVLIIGETGTGKELVAKAIHYNSPSKDGPLLDRNCGAMPRELLASDLFGHRKGAFTGATEDKMGLFEAASGGTLLLDEIGEMPEDAQLHLLRVLEEHEVQRLGEYIYRDVDVRIIAMTNRDLARDVTAGRFRKDLYYRLSEFPIHIPPLRERLDDIPLLADHFLQKACQQQDREMEGFAPGVMDMLAGYSWPGNIRELEHEIYRAVALAEDGSYVHTYHFSTNLTQEESLIQESITEGVGLSAIMDRVQRRVIEDALRECNGNRAQTARMLGIHRPNLIRLMKRLGIE